MDPPVTQEGFTFATWRMSAVLLRRGIQASNARLRCPLKASPIVTRSDMSERRVPQMTDVRLDGTSASCPFSPTFEWTTTGVCESQVLRVPDTKEARNARNRTP